GRPGERGGTGKPDVAVHIDDDDLDTTLPDLEAVPGVVPDKESAAPPSGRMRSTPVPPQE
ncbi:hypothetical protein ACFQ08_34535, partial [Streptosporangium algeriense]